MADIAEIGRKIARICDFDYDENTRMLYQTKDGDIIGYDCPSLDAIHEAEENMGFLQKIEYMKAIENIIFEDMKGLTTMTMVMLDDEVDWRIVHASFEQRLQAFLEVMDTKEMFDEN